MYFDVGDIYVFESGWALKGQLETVDTTDTSVSGFVLLYSCLYFKTSDAFWFCFFLELFNKLLSYSRWDIKERKCLRRNLVLETSGENI
eukprot:snap_masked-scaffold_1-processed-gene-30.45-mRNA-1 protein AED:1.00 eAED:1.00 QI:0/0/0/0/1/1/4/0/88